MKLLLIRHGESRGNLDRRWQGWLDEPLTERGRRQARQLAESLRRSEPVSAVYSSTLARAYQTAAILARAWDAPLVLDGRLRERDIGALQGLTWPEVQARHPDVVQTMRRRWVAPSLPGGETLAHLTERVWQAFQGIVERTNHRDADGSVAVVSHGGALNAYLNRLIGRGAEEPFLFSLGNASLSIVQFRDGRPRILQVNDVSHLDRVRG